MIRRLHIPLVRPEDVIQQEVGGSVPQFLQRHPRLPAELEDLGGGFAAGLYLLRVLA
jgi:hypothetical protein